MNINKFCATIKRGANAGTTVHVTHFDAAAGKSGKFVVDYPGSSAIGYFHAYELFPAADWHFGDNNDIVAGARTRPQFHNGDPFALIPHDFYRTDEPVLIALRSGKITMAYPTRGYWTAPGWFASDTMQEFLFAIPDRNFSDPSLIQDGFCTDGNYMVQERDVVAWLPLPALSPDNARLVF